MNLDDFLNSALPSSDDLRKLVAESSAQTTVTVEGLLEAPTAEVFDSALVAAIQLVHALGYLRAALAREDGGDGQ